MAGARPWVLRAGLGALLVLVVVTTWHVLVPAGQRLDETALGSVTLPWPLTIPVYHGIMLVRVRTVAVALVVATAVALGRRRPDLAVAAVVLVAGANLTTRLLKEVVPRPSFGIDVIGEGNTSPSGHTTAALGIGLALLLVLPPRLRLLAAALASGFGCVAGVGMLVAGHHRPGDMVAAAAVVVGWGALAVASAVAVRQRLGVRVRSAGTPGPWPLLAASLVGAAIVVGRIWLYGVVVGPGAGRSLLGCAAVAVTAGAVALGVTVVGIGARHLDRAGAPADAGRAGPGGAGPSADCLTS